MAFTRIRLFTIPLRRRRRVELLAKRTHAETPHGVSVSVCVELLAKRTHTETPISCVRICLR